MEATTPEETAVFEAELQQIDERRQAWGETLRLPVDGFGWRLRGRVVKRVAPPTLGSRFASSASSGSGESQFESYRTLGWVSARRAFGDVPDKATLAEIRARLLNAPADAKCIEPKAQVTFTEVSTEASTR